MKLTGREIVLGVTGGIAAFKSAEIVSLLRKQGANVHVIMTKNATQFVAPLTFETMSANLVVTDTFERPERWEVEHVALAKRAELFCIAPATANILAKLAWGLADDMLSTTALATRAPILVAPAMNVNMWEAEATRKNMAVLRERGVHVIGPDSGFLACGDSGSGRMSEPQEIVAAIEELLCPRQDYAGVKVLVTAGATRERLDPVRFLSNDSSGKMGFAIAAAARDRGADVTVVCGITQVEPPTGVRVIRVERTQELSDAVTAEAKLADVVIQAAAPADYRSAVRHDQKLTKQDGMPFMVELVENPDIAAAVGSAKRPGQVLVGFAAETEHLMENAAKKLQKKNLDMIVANDVSKPGAGFNVDTNIATLLTRQGATECPLQSKAALAQEILNKIDELRHA